MISNKEVIRVAYADDHIAVRRGITANLEKDGLIKVIIQGNNGEELLEQLMNCTVLPDVCLLDINMPKMDGFRLLKEIKRNWPEMGCLILTVFEIESYVIEMIKFGANGYILKSCDPEEIVSAVCAIKEDGYFYSEVAGNTTFNNVNSKKFKSILLTEREIDFLKYICTDLSYADIATEMKTTFKTVDGLRERICVKLNVTTRIGLALASIQLGYFSMLPTNN